MNKKIWIPKFNYYTKRLSMWQEKLWREVNDKPFMGILDNIAGRKTFEYATFGECGIQQSNSKLFGVINAKTPIIQKMTAACVWNASNAAAAAGGGAALETNVNRAARIYGFDSMGSWNTYGFASDANNWFGVAAFGAMTSTTYTDGVSTSRTIRSIHDADTGGTGGGDWYFSIDGISVSNSNSTWQDITWDDAAGTPRTVNRGVDTTYSSNVNSNSHWRDLTPAFDWTNVDATTDFVLETS